MRKAELWLGVSLLMAVAWWHLHDANAGLYQRRDDLARQVTELKAKASELEHSAALRSNPDLSWYDFEMRKKTAVATAYSCEGIKTEAERQMNCPNGKTSSGKVPSILTTLACARSKLGSWYRILDWGSKSRKGQPEPAISGLATLRECQDTGGAITEGRIDVYVKDVEQARKFGVREVTYVEE